MELSKDHNQYKDQDAEEPKPTTTVLSGDQAEMTMMNMGMESDMMIGDEEIMLVQGIIDAFFEEDGELILVDYKTDRVAGAQELRDRYQIQLDLYARALQQITGKRVREKLIYSVSLQETISL